MTLRKVFIPALCIAVFFCTAANVWAQSATSKKKAVKPSATKSAAAKKPTAPAVQKAPPQPAMAAPMDKRALDMLKKMSDTLSRAKTIKFQAKSMVPIMTPDGTWINLYGTSNVTVQGPDKLFASTAGDFAPYDFYFDGKTITAYSPVKNLYAVRPAPATISAMIEEAYQKEGKSFPYADILLSQPYDTLTKGLVKAIYVGQTTLREIKTNHLAFSNEGVEWQIWIGAEDNLPRLVVATYLDNTSEPSYDIEFSNWKINEPAAPETFVFKNSSNAPKVEFKNPIQQRWRLFRGPVNAQAEQGGQQ